MECGWVTTNELCSCMLSGQKGLRQLPLGLVRKPGDQILCNIALQLKRGGNILLPFPYLFLSVVCCHKQSWNTLQYCAIVRSNTHPEAREKGCVTQRTLCLSCSLVVRRAYQAVHLPSLSTHHRSTFSHTRPRHQSFRGLQDMAQPCMCHMEIRRNVLQ